MLALEVGTFCRPNVLAWLDSHETDVEWSPLCPRGNMSKGTPMVELRKLLEFHRNSREFIISIILLRVAILLKLTSPPRSPPRVPGHRSAPARSSDWTRYRGTRCSVGSSGTAMKPAISPQTLGGFRPLSLNTKDRTIVHLNPKRPAIFSVLGLSFHGFFHNWHPSLVFRA